MGTNRRHYMGQKSKEQPLGCQLKPADFTLGIISSEVFGKFGHCFGVFNFS